MNDILIDAQALATFANLEPNNIEEFHNSVYPDFVPPFLWRLPESEEGTPPDWKRLRNKLRDVWKEGFPLEGAIQLISSIFSLSVAEEVVNQPDDAKIFPRAWPFQRAVMFLAVNPWRVRFCQRCAKSFVANEPRSAYCSDLCFNESRKGTKRGWWAEHGQQWRDKKAGGKSKGTKVRAKKGRK